MIKNALQTFLRWLRMSLTKRWSIFILLTLVVALSILFLQPESLTGTSSKSIFIVGLFNFNLLLLIALGFVVGRNLIKLFLDRRNKILGSKLRQKLVSAFLLLTFIPTLIMFFLATGLISRATSGWFNAQVSSVVTNALFISQTYIKQEEQSLLEDSQQIISIVKNSFNLLDNEESTKELLAELRNKQQLFSFGIYTLEGLELTSDRSIVNEIPDLAEPKINQNNFPDTKNIQRILIENSGSNQFIRLYQQVTHNSQEIVVVLTRRIDPEITSSLEAIQSGFKEYGQLQTFKTPLKASYLLTLAIITGIILFSAIWIGFYLAREISEPLRQLSAGTKEVATGNYQIQITTQGDDELSELTESFNEMVQDLRTSEEELNLRRIYTETILDNLSVAVIGLDQNNLLIAANQAARRLFPDYHLEQSENLNMQQLLSAANFQKIHDFIVPFLLKQRYQDLTSDIVQKKITCQINNQPKEIIVTIGKVINQNEQELGTVILFDDISDLIHAQKIATWREAARRLAHEIKNPLTPIKLSAQRIIQQGDKLNLEQREKAAETILQNTEVIRVLIDEFSKFARLPLAELTSSDLNELIVEVLQSYENKQINFKIALDTDPRLKPVALDTAQFRRCLTNLIDNAISAVQLKKPQNGLVKITTKQSTARLAVLEISDNGTGITPEDRTRIFDPYFTTKADGSGLGLAIVATIVADHQGKIKVFENQPHGTRFVIELPVEEKISGGKRYGI